MNRLFFVAAIWFAFCIPLCAQEYPQVEIYGGYQLIVDDELAKDITYFSSTSTMDDYKRLNGFRAAMEYNIRRWIGIVGEVSHGRTSPILSNYEEFAPYPRSSAEYQRKQTSFLIGTRFSYRGERIRVFGHVLLGGNSQDFGYTFIETYEDGFRNVYERSLRNTAFATALGGGLDISLGKLISIRPVQLDLLSTYGSYTDVHHGDHIQHQLRYSGGVIFKLSSPKH